MKKAVIFDMDGVIIFSEPIYRKRRQAFFERHDILLNEETNRQFQGSNKKDMFQLLIPEDEQKRHQLKQAYDRFSLSYPIDYRAIFNQDILPTLKELKQRGIRMAVASSASLPQIQKVLDENQLLHYFELLVSGDSFERSKPDPEIYLSTVAQLGLQVVDCLVVEDSAIGVQAALSAGLEVAALGNRQVPANYFMDSVREIMNYLH